MGVGRGGAGRETAKCTTKTSSAALRVFTTVSASDVISSAFSPMRIAKVTDQKSGNGPDTTATIVQHAQAGAAEIPASGSRKRLCRNARQPCMMRINTKMKKMFCAILMMTLLTPIETTAQVSCMPRDAFTTGPLRELLGIRRTETPSSFILAKTRVLVEEWASGTRWVVTTTDATDRLCIVGAGSRV